jgi:hypothetical protein
LRQVTELFLSWVRSLGYKQDGIFQLPGGLFLFRLTVTETVMPFIPQVANHIQGYLGFIGWLKKLLSQYPMTWCSCEWHALIFGYWTLGIVQAILVAIWGLDRGVRSLYLVSHGQTIESTEDNRSYYSIVWFGWQEFGSVRHFNFATATISP